MLRNLHPGLEVLIFCTLIPDGNTTPPMLSGVEYRLRYLVDNPTLSRQRETLRCLALHDRFGFDLDYSPMSTNSGVESSTVQNLRLEEYLTTCFVDVTEHPHDFLFVVPDSLLETLRVLYLINADVLGITFPHIDHAIQENVELTAQLMAPILKRLYWKAVSKPPLRYIVFGVDADTILLVTWAKNPNTVVSQFFWFPVVEGFRFTKHYHKLHPETFPLYDVALETCRGNVRVPAFRTG
ncbi:hypothetical protein TWF696_001449 [Orbilia brochopaga]|uniref:Uncharacterized protein n=1 Tax=Orbilia brochopaga TaxID=3140254 RepID=A0AAV9U8P2_9PEZI